jgi:hypothetical protein
MAIIEPADDRDLAACALYLRRGAARWRNPTNNYSPTASGLIDAMKDELQAAIPQAAAQEQMETKE